VRAGKEYNLRLQQRARAIFSTLMGLLPSNWISTVQGPNYTNELKAVAKLELRSNKLLKKFAPITNRKMTNIISGLAIFICLKLISL
jgi:hypothetical protein